MEHLCKLDVSDLLLCLSFQCSFPPKIAPAGTESTQEKYGTFLNAFHPDVKRIIQRIEREKYKIGRSEVTALFNQTDTHTHTHTHIYIYIYIMGEEKST